jgi:hypothetical protein
MSRLLISFSHCDKTSQFYIVAAASALLTATSIWFFSLSTNILKIKKIKSELKVNEFTNDSSIEEQLIKEQLSRNESFLGKDSLMKVRKSFVIVVGLGGVGSHAAHMLIRSGVQHM